MLNLFVFYIVSDDLTAKSVNGLTSGLTKIRNELKFHDTPATPNDKFGALMAVSFLCLMS